jgi:hypothetical protein
MTDNLTTIKDGSELQNLIETHSDCINCVLFFLKSNNQCRSAKTSFERISLDHPSTQFIIVDFDKYEGECKLVNTSNLKVPTILYFFAGNRIGEVNTGNSGEIENKLKMAENQYIKQVNGKGMNGMSIIPGIQMNQPYIQPQMQPMNQMQQPQFNYQQISNEILNHLRMTNPQQAQLAMSNPTILNQLVQQRMQQLSQMQPMQPVQPTFNPYMSQPLNASGPSVQLNALASSLMASTQNPMTPLIVPTMEQLACMVKIFLMLQEMGLLKDDLKSESIDVNSVKKSDSELGEVVELPDGRKLIRQPDGRYGLVAEVNDEEDKKS